MLYVIKGDPIPLARPRFGNRCVWDSQKAKKVIAGIELRHQHGDRPLFKKALKVECIFYFKIPKTRTKTLKPNSVYFFKPDIDNLVKFVLDIANKICYTDDSIVAEITSKKLYDINPRTEITIIEMDNSGKKS